MRKFTEGLYAYGFALLVCLAAGVVFLIITPQSRTEHIPRVDYSIDQANVARAAPYGLVAPSPVPAGWIPTSSRVVTRPASAVSWQLGFATGARQHAMVAQSNEQPSAAYANRVANTATVSGSRQINGRAWQERVREDPDQRSLVLVDSDHAIVITGTADWNELTALAAALHPVPAPAK
ncbi:DUF4245 domain-containing protein [Streptosporangiaceae bacterium NEAU-GS5]|nr:DUF4245 domain-containing protein [Streptosporangiaceae bacterium NEAU-GS5]